MKRTFRYYMLLTLLTFLLQFQAHSQTQTTTEGRFRENFLNALQFSQLQWRNIGPFRGGRAVAIAGVPRQPMTYYMGSTGGGIWKTEDAGISWSNSSDGFFGSSSVGAIAVAPSDHNIIYVGMGEHPVRGVMTSAGDGVYKSVDGGKTWKHIGLVQAEHIAAIRIHPDNPDLIYVAVQGALYADSRERGIYMTTDGGLNWTKVLYINGSTGAADLSMDPNNPRVLYAALWDHQRKPWQIRSGGRGSGIFKSVDGGRNWSKICKGLPEKMGKIGVAVSPANSEVVYANIEAENGGVFRSTDEGNSWTQVSNDRSTVSRAWYYIKIIADPRNENTVYVLNDPLLKSIDGGKTFTEIPTDHSDQHQLWINPDNPENMALANDGGACISFNGGKTWSSQNNQPTGQFYRVITDNQFPYHIYGGQQDNSTVAISSRTSDAGIDEKDWLPVSGCESGFIAFDPDQPELIYGGCYQGYISVYNRSTQSNKDIMAYPEMGLATTPKEMRYRFNWNAPIIAQPQDPSIIYHAANVVLKTTDGGINWTPISPDLTRDEPSRQGLGGIPFTNEGAGAENYNTISYLACSPHEAGVIWVGTDDGLVHVTSDEGKNWTAVTPPPLEDKEALINSIEISPTDPATAYVVATRYKFNDKKPYIFITRDMGKNWELINKGIRANHFVRVVREDPVNSNILYAGTENGMYISFDAGAQWNAFQLNLPVCPITDICIQDNDLVVSTSGRAFWILDDIGAIQQSNGEFAYEPMLFQPDPTVRFDVGSTREENIGKNPPNGLIIDYFLPRNSDRDILTLEIVDKNGQVIRSFSNQRDEHYKSYHGGPAPDRRLPSEAGINRFSWDLTGYSIPGVKDVFLFGSYKGHRVAPGEYTIRLITPRDTFIQTATILPDPRVKATQADYEEQEQMMKRIEELLREIHQSVSRMQDLKGQIVFLTEQLKKAGCVQRMIDRGVAIQESITEWEKDLVQFQQKNAQDVINFPNTINTQLADLLNRVNSHDPKVTTGVKARFRDLEKQWKGHYSAMMQILGKDIADFNQMYKEHDVPALVVPN